jgi:hypothetical protein
MFTSKDEDGDIFVLVQAVDQEMCKILTKIENDGRLFLSQHADINKNNFSIITECSIEPINIIFSLNDTRIPGKNCKTHKDCALLDGGYCDTNMGVCQCPTGTEISESGTSCISICNTKIETECWDDNIRWCCGGQTICGKNPNECIESDGFCRYSFKNSQLTAEIPCPKQKYCYLAFTSKGCSNTADESGSNPLWGVCLNMGNVFTSANDCPILN